MDSIWLIIFFTVFGFVVGQNIVINIGVRYYSMWHESHFLIKRKGITKLIYFKPKHFNRYALFEVLSFFISYLILFVGIVLIIISIINSKNIPVSNIVIGIMAFSQFFFAIIVVIINDITKAKEEAFYKNKRVEDDLIISEDLKNVENNVKGLYIVAKHVRSMRFRLDDIYAKKLKNLQGKPDKIELLNEEFIHYYRNYKKIAIENDKIIIE